MILGFYSKNFKFTLGGIDFYRCFEYGEIFRNLRNLEGKTVIDIGSSETIFPQFLAKKGSNVLAVDISLTVRNQHIWNNLLKTQVNTFLTDGRLLPFRDNSVNICTSISAIEHAKSHGDCQIILEIERILKPGALAFVSIPYTTTYEEFCYSDGRGLMRRYDEMSLNRRIIQKTNLRLVGKIYFGDAKYRRFINSWYRSPFFIQIVTAWMRTFLGPFLISNTSPKKSGGVFLVFKKAYD